MEEKEQGPRCTKVKCKNCCKSFTAFLFSTLGLVIMVAAYSIFGGFLFHKIEEGPELKRIQDARDLVTNVTVKHIEYLWDVTNRLNILYRENWTAEAQKVMLSYQKELYSLTTEDSWDGKENHMMIEANWNFANALLYAVTAITTIGYGHVTPKTYWGMWSTMIYCLFGLPLTLMCIANLGKFFARVFRILYHTCCCGICCICCLSYRKRRLAKKLRSHHGDHLGEPIDLEALGNGQTLTITNDPNAKDKTDNTSKKGKSRPAISISKTQVWLSNVKKKFTQSMRDDVTVPVYLCLVVMAAYILAGALLFSLWDDWKYIEGAYFCFVTLTTIGFGDYVPGVVGHQGGKKGTERLILCSLYVFFGLALVGMCIDLMQADVLHKMRWIAQKIGIMSADNKKVPFHINKNVPAAAIHRSSKTDSSYPCSSTTEDDKFVEDLQLQDNSQKLGLQLNEICVEQETVLHSKKKQSKKSNKDKRKSSKIKGDCPAAVLGAEIVTHRESNGAAGYIYNRPMSGQMVPSDTTQTLSVNEQVLTPEKIDTGATPNSDRTQSPPPTYTDYCLDLAAAEQGSPTSCYDDLPSHISNMTPEHLRLKEVASPLIQPQGDNHGNNRSSGWPVEGLLVSEDTLSTRPLLHNTSGGTQPGADVSMEMRTGVNGELTLSVTSPSQ